MPHCGSSRQLQNKHFCYRSLLLERTRAEKPVHSAKIHWKEESWGNKTSFLPLAGYLLPQNAFRADFARVWLLPISRGCCYMGKGGAEGPFLARAVVKHLLCPFHPRAQVLHRLRMKRLQQHRSWVKMYSRQDGEPSTSLQDSPVKVRLAPQALRSLKAKIHS